MVKSDGKIMNKCLVKKGWERVNCNDLRFANDNFRFIDNWHHE